MIYQGMNSPQVGKQEYPEMREVGYASMMPRGAETASSSPIESLRSSQGHASVAMQRVRDLADRLVGPNNALTSNTTTMKQAQVDKIPHGIFGEITEIAGGLDQMMSAIIGAVDRINSRS